MSRCVDVRKRGDPLRDTDQHGEDGGAVASVDRDRAPLQDRIDASQTAVLDEGDLTPVPAPAGALERVLAALAGATHAGASWADPVDAGDEAAALARLRADAATLADPVDPQALRTRLGLHVLALELLASRFAVRAEGARRDVDRVALAGIAVRALAAAARTSALLAATAPAPLPPTGTAPPLPAPAGRGSDDAR